MEFNGATPGNERRRVSDEGMVADNLVINSGELNLNNDGGRGGSSGNLHAFDLNEAVNVELLHDHQGLDLNKPIFDDQSMGVRNEMIDLNMDMIENFENVGGGEKKVRWFDLNVESKEDEDGDEIALECLQTLKKSDSQGNNHFAETRSGDCSTGVGYDRAEASGSSRRREMESEGEEAMDEQIEPAYCPTNVALPPSSAGLDLVGASTFDAFYVYAFLRSFSTMLFLSPFEAEDLLTCLKCNEATSLLDNIHVSLLRTLRTHLKSISHQCLRCLNWDHLDVITWPVFVVEYLLLQSPGYIPGSKDFEPFQSDYYKMPVSAKVDILRHLCDGVLESEAFRSEVDRRTSTTDEHLHADVVVITEGHVSEATDSNGVECPLCKMDGNLTCCDGCPAAYHARCVGVVSQLPEGDWYCPECVINKDKPWNKMEDSVRGAELLGTDPHGRRYYASFGYLLVSKCSNNEEYSFWFYKRNDLPNLIEALESSPLPCVDIIKAITKQWEVTHRTESGPDSSNRCASMPDDTQMNLTSSKYGYETSTMNSGGVTSDYVNFYRLAQTAASVSEELTSKLSDRSSRDATNYSEERIIAVQMKNILNRSAEFSWSNMESSKVNLNKEKCGWCIYCKTPEDGMNCLFIMKANIPAVEKFSSEALEIQTRTARKNHLVDVICHIICMEDHLKGLLLGPWLDPHYSQVWRKRAREADDIASAKALLLELESNLHHRALSAGWYKHVDSVGTMGSASHTVGSTKRVSLTRGSTVSNKRKCSKMDVTRSSEAASGLCSLWWRGGRMSRELFNWKVLPRSLAAKAARQGGCQKISGVQYRDSGNAKRMKYTAWRAAVERSRSVEQLALQIRELDANIRWDDIGNSHFLEKMGKGSKKPTASFKNVTIRRKSCEGNVVRYLLDFGKRRSIPNIVVRNGTAVEDSSSRRKKYWLDEPHVPLHLLKEFEEKRIARRSNKVVTENVRERSGLTKKPLQRKGFEYLLSKAERSESCQCGHCNEAVPIREDVTCQNCQGFFHERHAQKSDASTTVVSTYTCRKCHDTNFTQVDAGNSIPESSKRKKKSKELGTPLPGKGKKMKSKEKPKQSKMKATEVPSVEPLRRSARSSKRFSLLLQSLKAKGRKKRGRAEPEEDDFLKKLHVRRKKRIPVNNSSYWLNGLQLSREINDERLMQFRRKLLLVVSGDETSIEPKCCLCSEEEHTSNLNYVACEICGVWFHADALGVGANKIENIIGFKCHQCLNKRTPICPHHCPTGSNNTELVSVSTAETECDDRSTRRPGQKRKRAVSKGRGGV